MKASGSDGRFILHTWEVVQWYYCPRKLYFLRTLGVPVALRRKMEEGSREHVREMERLAERKEVFGLSRDEVKTIYHRLRLESEGLGLAGQVDLVLELSGGDLVPVEIKYSDYMETFIGRKKQLVAYALLLEERFGRPIHQGLLYYPLQNREVAVDISYKDKRNLVKDLERIREIIASERLPRRADPAKCSYCEVAKYCAT